MFSLLLRESSLFRFYAAEYLRVIAGKSPKTVSLVEYILKEHLLPIFGARPISKITIFELRDYVAHASKHRKVYNHLKYFKAIIKLAKQMDVPVRDYSDVACPDTGGERLHIYSPQEITKLIAGCKRYTWGPGKRRLWNARFIIMIAYTMGLRKSSILGLKWEWVDFTKGILIIPARYLKKTKDNSPHEMPINKTVLRIMRARRLRNPNDIYVFPGQNEGPQTDIDRTWTRLLRNCQIKGEFHGLRATCAVQLCMAGVNVEIVCKLLRMTPDVLRRHYIDVPPGLARFAIDYAAKLARQNPEAVMKLIRDPVTGALKKVS